MNSAVHPALASRRRGLHLLLITLGLFVVYLDGTIVNVALPDIQSSLGTGLRGLQWVVDAYVLAFGCLQMAAGTVGDSVGHRPLFLTGLIGFTACSAVCALSGSIEWLLAGRAVQGAFGAILIPVSLAMIRGMYPEPAERAKAIGIWASVGGLALAAGPVLGGWLVEAYGWESIFWINVPVGIVVAALLLAAKAPAAPRQARKLDAPGQIGFLAFIGLLAFALIEGHSRGWGSPEIAGSLAASGVALVAFLVWELRAKQPMFPLRLFRNPVVTAAAIVNFLGFLGLYAILFQLTMFWQSAEGLSPVETGVRFLSLTASIMVFSFLGSSWSAKLAPRLVIPASLVAIAAALAGLTLPDPGDSYLSYAWALVLLGFGISMAGTSATNAVMGAVTPERAGAASGIVSTTRQVSAIFGVALAGTVLSSQIEGAAPGALAKLPLAGEAKERLLEAWRSGAIGGELPNSAPGDVRELVAREGARLFAEGMHATMALSAALSVLGAAASLLLFRLSAGRKAGASAREPEEPRPPSAVPSDSSPGA